jgi:disulfide bond formation protein DsbB
VYLTACSITVAAVGITLKDGSIASYLISGLFSLLGLFICLQMSIAQARFRSDNHYWERLLRRAEAADEWEGPKIFTSLHAFREKPEIAGETGATNGIIANFGVRWHRNWWGARMKALPLVFAIVFVLTFIASIVLAVKAIRG